MPMSETSATSQDKRERLARLIRDKRRADGTFTLTAAQNGMWMQQQLAPSSTAYNIPVAFCLRGALPDAAGTIARVLDAVIERHAALRLTFSLQGEVPVQHVAAPVPVRLECSDISEHGDNWHEAFVERESAQSSKPFDLAHSPLYRFHLLRVRDDLHVLLATFHHIVMDGWSIGVFLKDFARFYLKLRYGREQEIPTLSSSYRDYVDHLMSPSRRASRERSIAYWTDRLADAPSDPGLPTDFRRGTALASPGATHAFAIDVSTSQDIANLARHEGATLFMALLATFYAMLSRTCSADDFAVGVSVSHRDDRAWREVVGLFSDVLPMRMSVDATKSFVDLLARVRTQCLSDYDHDAASLNEIMAAARRERDVRGLPFRVGFDFQNTPWPEIVGDALALLHGDAGASKLDLNFNLSIDRGQLLGVFEYDTSLFAPATIRRLAWTYQALLKAVVDRPSHTMSALRLMDADAERACIARWRAPLAEASVPVTSLLERLSRHAMTQPLQPAISDQHGELSYASLWRSVNAFSRDLHTWGVNAGDTVALSLAAGRDAMVAMLGALVGGVTYVPLDPAMPAARRDRILADAGAVLVVHDADAGRDSYPCRHESFAFDDGERDVTPLPVHAEEMPAYVIYTSGSTGAPKGVQIGRAALWRFVERCADQFQLGHADRAFQLASIGFDTSIEEIFPALYAGACVVVASRAGRGTVAALIDEVSRRRVSVLNLPTALWHEAVAGMAEDSALRLPPAVRLVVIGGEAASPAMLASWQTMTGTRHRLLNTYGPTEATVAVASCDLTRLPDADRLSSLPIGRAYAGCALYVLDASQRPVDPGNQGGLYIAGDTLALGYRNAPAMTQSAFMADPWSDVPGARMYRTGDRVRELDDGSLRFEGRDDGQVKIAGYRVELAEVEAALAVHPDIRQATVLHTADDGMARLHAFVQLAPGVLGENPETWRQWLAARLPASMVPASIIVVDTLPTTINGKLDRRALLAMVAARVPALTRDMRAMTPTESALAALWAELLHVPAPAPEDNFFALGGHSLLAIRMLSRIQRSHGIDLTLADVFEAPSLAALAVKLHLGKQRSVEGAEATVPAGRWFRQSRAQQRLWFLHALDGASTAYGNASALRLRGPFDVGLFERALQGAVDRHEMLRAVFDEHDGVPMQRVLADRAVTVAIRDLRDVAHPEQECAALRDADARQMFDVRNGPLFRATVVRMADEEHVMLFNWHHLITDAWSAGILVRELVERYAALTGGKPPMALAQPTPYAAFVAREAAGAERPEHRAALARWAERLADLAPLPLFAAPHDAMAGDRTGARVTRAVDEGVRAGLNALAAAHGVTPYMVCLSAFAWTLARLSGEHDVSVISPVSLRARHGFEHTLGYFINTLPLRIGIEGDASVADLLAQVREHVVAAYADAHVPFEDIVRVAPGAAPSISFVMDAQDGDLPELPGTRVTVEERGTQDAKFELSLTIYDRPSGMTLECEYPRARYSSGTMRRFVEHVAVALTQWATASPAALLDDLSLGEGDETRAWEAGETVAVPVETLVEAVSRHARQTPTQRAVVYEGQALDYRTLDAWSDELAARLCAAGVEAGHRVGVQLPRSLGLPAALLAVWKAGAAYVPLDPAQPLVRRQGMAADAGLHTVVCLAADAAQWQGDGYAVVAMDAAADTAGMTVPARSGELAYVMFTSGSTGRPKGVMVGHRQVANLSVALDRVLAEGGISGACQWAWNASYAFDASLQALTQWRHGSTLHLLDEPTRQDPQRLLAYLRTEGIEVLDATPLQAETLLAACGESSLPTLLVGGEAIGQTLWQSLAAHYRGRGQAALNVYGPTETTVDATMARVEGERPTIGRPLANTWVGVLDARGRRVPVGVPGELWIGGAGVAEGYAGQASDRFVMHEIDGESRRLYRTGDRARWREDGQLDYLGRLDGQVKIRGYRIELEDVASALRRRTDVATAVVQVRGEDIHRRLLAWAVPAAATDDTSHWARTLEAALAEELPAWMVPQVVPVDALPLTPNGKLDARALPVPVIGQDTDVPAPAINATEAEVIGIWADLLDIPPERIGRRNHFFRVGGHSLLLMRLATALRSRLGADIALRSLFDEPTPEAIARQIDEVRATQTAIEDITW